MPAPPAPDRRERVIRSTAQSGVVAVLVAVLGAVIPNVHGNATNWGVVAAAAVAAGLTPLMAWLQATFRPPQGAE